jgi:N-methylhydantoinase A/oxoprolinase/acetone carboxylase beta subunit
VLGTELGRAPATSQGRSVLIGVDTGGTYTDAAIVAVDRREVIASAKAITTKGDFAIGVSEAIAAAMAQLPADVSASQVSLVSVSTTLATNAVVEGHGSAVGAILVGFDTSMVERTGIAASFPGMPIECIRGGHDHNGEESAPLDIQALEASLLRTRALIDAYAVASTFAVRNPAHEERVREIIAASTGKPVTLSTELSSDLDAPRRALTAVLNARLISRISLLIDAVQRTMRELGILCPLMVVKGDGTLALAERVAMRPIETVLSGPAASLVGARWLSGRDDFIMCDMGGTTTDLGVLTGGRPRISSAGADIGGWRTMVRAIDARTVGLGGDSEVAIGVDGTFAIGPGRIVPVSLIGARYPEFLSMLDGDLAETEGGSLLGKFVLRPFGERTRDAKTGLSAREREVLALVSERPTPMRKAAVSSGAQRAVQALRRKGLVQVCGFTPSDAAHVLGVQDNWSRQAAEKSAHLLVRFRDMKQATPERVSEFCRQVWSEVVRLTGRAILDAAFGCPVGGDPLIDAVCAGRGRIGLARVELSPEIPVVAVGAPAKIYYEEVGRRLGAEVIFPPFYGVANAVGAATGVIARSVTTMVHGDGSGIFRVHTPSGTVNLASAREATEMAEAAARSSARDAVLSAGGEEPEVRVSIERHLLPDAVNSDGLLTATITAEAISRPAQFRHARAPI